MNKKELVESVVAAQTKSGLSKRAVVEIIGETFAAITKGIKKNGRFNFPGFGTFTVRARAARKGRNPQTGETIKIKASKSIKFKAAPSLKRSL